MKKETFTHFCIDVFVWDWEEKEYKEWFTQTFATKKLAKCWENGFKHANTIIRVNEQVKQNFKTSEIYRRYRSYKANII